MSIETKLVAKIINNFEDNKNILMIRKEIDLL